MVFMDKRQLGGLAVSPIGLGTSSWGTRTTDFDNAAHQLKMFSEAGGNLLDTANIYGDAECIVGQLIAGRRDEFVIATKGGGVPGDGIPRANATREHLRSTLEESLRRLNVDHVDLWQLHGWDPDTPIDETLSFVDGAVKDGKIRYAGVCNYNTKQLLAAVGSGVISSLQMEYSLLERRLERNLVPAAIEHGIGVLPWAPLGRGVLTGKYLKGVPEQRLKSRFFQWYVRPFLDDRATRIATTVAEVADGMGVTPLAVAFAWVRDCPGVVAPLVGARTPEQLRESLDAVGVVLPDDARRTLDQASAPAHQ
jgi:aryl-alcohol dehydrogenase-like predicted oxidoreductase